MDRPIRVLTWNVQGSADLDGAAAATVVGVAGADVIALQEIQRAQARRLAEATATPQWRWVRKHWPVVHRPEGLAVLTPHRIVRSRRVVLRRAPPWSWRRRVGLDLTVDTGEVLVRVLVAHLSPHGDADQRVREAAALVTLAGREVPGPLVLGDLNDQPGGRAIGHLETAGWRDAWAVVHGGDAGGATNWPGGDRAGRPATQRIDYVLVPGGWRVDDAVVIDRADVLEHVEEMGVLSDHLPLLVSLTAERGAPS